MIKEGDWVLYKDRNKDQAHVLAVVVKINREAYHLHQIIDGESHPLAITGKSKITPAPVSDFDDDPFLIDLALMTKDKKWFKNLLK